MPSIHIRGARTHNLQNIDLELPRDRLIVFTGLSGSGKSSLAFDTIYAEGQRRYVESLSAYARQFLSMMDKPDVDGIEGLSPAISIEQKSTSHNPRSTVGTVTEIYDYLRLLYARAGHSALPGSRAGAGGTDRQPDGGPGAEAARGNRCSRCSPRWSPSARASTRSCSRSCAAQGFVRARIDGKVVELEDAPSARPQAQAYDRSGGRSLQGTRRRARSAWPNPSRRRSTSAMAWRASPGSRSRRAKSSPFPIAWPARSAATACPSSSRGCSRSTTRSAPATSCDGLGIKQFFDPQRVVGHPHLSLAGGAVRGWDRRNAYYFQLIQALARHYEFDIDTPVARAEQRRAGHAAARQWQRADRVPLPRWPGQDAATREHRFEGIIPNLERRYRETESVTVREELAKYLSNRPCPECEGTRLNRAARNVFVAERTLPQATSLSVAGGAHVLQRSYAGGLARRSGCAHRQGDRRPPAIPGERGARVPHARSQRRDAFGWRSAAHPARQPGRLRAGRRDVHPRRALDRAAPARQPATAADPEAAARPRQHRHRRRARRGSDPQRRSCRRSRARRRRARRTGRGAGHAARPRGERRVDHGPVPVGTATDRDPAASHRERWTGAARAGRHRATT